MNRKSDAKFPKHRNLSTIRDDEIDLTDAPEVDETFFKKARLVVPTDHEKTNGSRQPKS